MIYVHKTLHSFLLSTHAENRTEAITCEIRSAKGNSMTICCVYCPPDYSLANSPLLSYLTSVAKIPNDFLVVSGDFNSPCIDWSGLHTPPQSSPLWEWSMNNFLSQNISYPTRPQSQNILDLVFSDVATTIERVCVHECFGSSDHAIITFDIFFPSPCPESEPHYIRSYSNANWRRFDRILKSSLWPKKSTRPDVNSMWLDYLSNIASAIESSIPLKLKKTWNSHNTSKVRSAMRCLRRSNKAYKVFPSLKNMLSLQLSQQKLQQCIAQETLSHEKAVSSQLASNPKRFWSYVNTRIKTGTSQYVLSKDCGDKVTDHNDVAEMFNDYFAKSFSPKDDNTISDVPAQVSKGFLDRIHFTPKLVYDVVKRLPHSTSCDSDGICYTIVKNSGMFFSEKLSELFNISMMTGKIPIRWKKIIVTPIHKSGARDKCANYRPIAVTSCILRIMERIMSHRLLSFLQNFDLIFPTQHGFIPNKSVETAEISFFDYLTNELDTGKTVHVAYLDFSKAFDSVPHKLLLTKLTRFGISGALLSWITDYLSDRSQSVRIFRHLSIPKDVKSGVIQGSVLGPVLFLMFINDLDPCLRNSLVVKYADDVKLATSSCRNHEDEKVAIRNLQSDLDCIQLWSTQNGIALNPRKCKVMTFGTTSVLDQFLVNGDSLEQVNNFKDLGILVSSPLSFNGHVASICLTANRKLGVIKRSFLSRDPKLILTLYKLLVRPSLEFACVIWCPYRKNNIDLIEKVQKRLCRLFKSLRCLEYRDQLTDASWPGRLAMQRNDLLGVNPSSEERWHLSCEERSWFGAALIVLLTRADLRRKRE